MAKGNKGWIKLHRQIMNNAIWTAAEPFDRRSAWIDLLMMANHEQRRIILKDGTTIIVEEGQLFTSMDHLATRWHWSRNKVRRYISLLTTLKMCHQCGTRSGTLLTLVKYGFFQGGRPTDGPPDGTPDEPSDGPADEPRTRINNTRTNNTRMNYKKEASPSVDSRGTIIEE